MWLRLLLPYLSRVLSLPTRLRRETETRKTYFFLLPASFIESARSVAVLRASLGARFPVTSGAISIEHDDRGEAQEFDLLPEPMVDAIGSPAAGANALRN